MIWRGRPLGTVPWHWVALLVSGLVLAEELKISVSSRVGNYLISFWKLNSPYKFSPRDCHLQNNMQCDSSQPLQASTWKLSCWSRRWLFQNTVYQVLAVIEDQIMYYCIYIEKPLSRYAPCEMVTVFKGLRCHSFQTRLFPWLMGRQSQISSRLAGYQWVLWNLTIQDFCLKKCELKGQIWLSCIRKGPCNLWSCGVQKCYSI